MSVNWKFLKCETKSRKKDCKRLPANDHPLIKSSFKFVSKHSSNKNVPSDPLSMALDGYDPLSMYSEDYYDAPSTATTKTKDEWQEAWQSRRAAILTKYTTAEKLSIISSYLPGGEKILMKTQTYVVDQVKTRLEQLDDFEEGSVRQMLNLSQQEYVLRIDMLNRELVQAWNTEQRVKALKIAIQCSKLLVDTTVIQFYPSKFVLITDILDIFGKLVYDRLRNKAEYFEPIMKKNISLPNNFTPDMVPEMAKETCLNWLYKMASIRELVPRLYIEMSLLKCYSFLTLHEFDSALKRITSMIRGIGHPLVAVYARFYLCRVGLSVGTSNKDFFVQNMNDFLLTYPQVFNKNVVNELAAQNVDINKYIHLYSPALDWMLFGMVEWSNVSSNILNKLIDQCKDMNNSDLLLRSIISSLKPSDITSRALQLLELICLSSSEDQTMSDMIAMLGQRVCCGGRSTDDKKLLSSVWRILKHFKQPKYYLACAEPWVQFTAINFSSKQIDWLLGDIYAFVTQANEPVSEFYSQLQAILKKIALFTPDIEELLTQEHLLPMLELFDAGSYLMVSSKAILTTYQSQQSYMISDEVLISNLMHICLLLHDSINSFTVDDEMKHISELVCRFIKSVSFGKDFQRQLKFYTEVRASFFKLDQLNVLLVQLVNNLSMNARSLSMGKSTQKLEMFVRCCSAYSYITVPSVTCPFTKIQMYLLTGQVALINRCYLQAEDCLKASLHALIKIPPKSSFDGQMRSTDGFIVLFLSSFMSTLLMLPDKQQNGNFLYMFKGMLKAMNCLSWDTTPRYMLLLKAIDLLANLIQEDYLYHAGDAVANDSFLVYNSDYIDQVNDMGSHIIDELLSILKQLGESNEFHKQSLLALELFWKIIKRGDTNVKEIEVLTVNLWNLAHKHKNCVDHKISMKMFVALESEAINPNIVSKLKNIMK